MRILVWQWGRRGAGPLFATRLAEALRSVPGTEVILSLATGAEILRAEAAPYAICRSIPIPAQRVMCGSCCRHLVL